ncbi:MAG: LptF/LptG family permease [Phycisphaeraceae bacterium]|nr:LptF/LptG family permease [Phycisphaeraceae bacterium]
MPWTLYRYILKDLLKLFAVSALALVAVISVASSLQPLSQGLLRPGTFLKFVYYTAPMMLQFAAPFAVAFAATATFSRLKNDNEILAACAAGLSYRTLLVPVVFVGLLLTLALFTASNWWIPRFYQHREQLLFTEDPEVLLNLINRGQPIRLEDWLVYADHAQEGKIPPEALASVVPPKRRLTLHGFAGSRADDQGRLRAEVTAESADVYVFVHEGQTWMTVRLRNVMLFHPDEGVLLASDDFELPRQRIVSSLRDDPQFLSLPELRQLGRQPERFGNIHRARRELYFAMMDQELLRQMPARLTAPAPAPGSDALELLAGPDQHRYHLQAPRVERRGDVLLLQADPRRDVRLEEEINGSVQRVANAKSATIELQHVQEPRPDVLMLIELSDVQVHDAATGSSTGHTRLTLPRARWPQPTLPNLASASTAELIHAASLDPFVSSISVADKLSALRTAIADLLRKAIAQLHDRAATAVSGALVLLLATVMSLRQHGRMILVTFAWVFLFTTLAVVLAEGGREVTTRPNATIYPGLAILWTGNLLLAGASVYNYLKLIRH